MAKILVIHGAGMNMRGKVGVDVFGPMTLPDYNKKIEEYAKELGVEVKCFHSNVEGEVADAIYASHDDGTDAIIINPADDLERNAANALLKSLEEPPAGTFFLLVTHRPGLLLPTIRSRARILRFNPLPSGDVEKALRAANDMADPADIALAARASGGAPGAGLAFLAQELGPAEALMRRIATEGDPDFVLRGKLGEEIGARPDRARLSATLDLARTVLAQKLENPDTLDIPALVDAHSRLVTISGQAKSYNFDPGFLAMEIGTLLASAAPLRA